MGEKDAFLNLYKGLYRNLAGFGLRVYGDSEMVTDTLNQVFLELWEKHDKLPRVEQVESYLRTILKRKILACGFYLKGIDRLKSISVFHHIIQVKPKI